jgi:hypothetical protein
VISPDVFPKISRISATAKMSDLVGLTKMKGNGVATLAQKKIFPAKQELLLSEITGLPLD